MSKEKLSHSSGQTLMNNLPVIREHSTMTTDNRFLSQINMARYPLFNFHKKAEMKIGFQDGERYFWATSDSRFGHPGAFAHKVYAAVECLLYERIVEFGELTMPLEFSCNDVCKLLDATPSGRMYDKIRRVLQSILHTTVHTNLYKRRMENGRVERYSSQESVLTYRRIDFVEKVDLTGKTRVIGINLWLSEFTLSNYKNGYICHYDFQFFLKLHNRNAVAAQMYMYLSLLFYYSLRSRDNKYDIRYSTLCQHIGLKQYTIGSRAKSQLREYHRILKVERFIESVQWIARKEDWLLCYVIGEKAKEDHEINDKRKARRLSNKSGIREIPSQPEYEVLDVDASDLRSLAGFLSSQLASKITVEQAGQLLESGSEEQIKETVFIMVESFKNARSPVAMLFDAVKNPAKYCLADGALDIDHWWNMLPEDMQTRFKTEAQQKDKKVRDYVMEKYRQLNLKSYLESKNVL